MTEPSLPLPLSDEQKQQFCSMLLVGCDRETASKYLGCTPTQLRDELKRNPEFSRQVLRAEGSAEFHQICNLHEATKDSKQWRASVWWLERKAPGRYARRVANAITEAEWQQFLESLADAIVTEITNEADRRRLLAYLARMAQAAHTDLAKDPRDSVPDTPKELSTHDTTDDITDESDQS